MIIKHMNIYLSNKTKGKRGFTLLELIVSLAIVGIILVMVFSINLFGIRSFALQDNQSSLQTDIRFAADAITREVRLANSVEILSAVPGTFDPGYSYLYTQTSGSVTSVLLTDSSGTKTITSYSSAVLTFSTVSPSRTLEFNISGALRDQNFNITSKVVPLNFPQDGSITPNGGSGIALKFSKITPIISGAITITNSLPNAYVGSSYTEIFNATGGNSPYTYTLHSGTLPAGLTLSTNGILQGNLTAPNAYEFTVQVQDYSSPVKSGYRTYFVIVGDSSIDAATVLSGIGVNIEDDPATTDVDETVTFLYPILPPQPGETSLVFPINLPPGFSIVIESVSSSPTVLGIDGTLIPHNEDDPVVASLWIKVLNLIDSDDSAATPTLIPLLVSIPPGVANAAPVASAVTISGQSTTGMTLNGLYTYSDAEGNPEGSSIYKWYTSVTGQTTDKVEIIGATSSAFMLTSNELGKYIYFEVTPVATTGTLTGIPVISAATSMVSLNQAPVATGTITGEAKVGFTLTGTYTYSDAEGDLESGTQLKWYKSDKIGGARTLIGTGSTYLIKDTDNGIYISFEITPAAATGTSPGGTVLVTSAKVKNN